MYFAIRGGKVKRVDAASVVEAASVDIFSLDPLRTYAADLLRESTRADIISSYSTAKAEQTYFAIRGGKAKRVDAASVVEAASVFGGKSHFAAKLRICPPRHACRYPRHDAESMRIMK
ncbi:hypothetical protein DPMN_176004 [Dreissena polymorpha]|uniref:Uncharacterized protein n=1 Tax=Dreissena polymorpha TaxID=45954 RepID=A0A9D4IJ96_DREPO|nr:hypothetical protein DPMN_176004 [Dreissena polymorpha]